MLVKSIHKGLVLTLAFWALSCGNSPGPNGGATSTASQSCTTGTAVIQVGDSFLMRVCGCNEVGNTLFSVGSALSCTVSSGTNIVFLFEGALNPHQILSFGTLTFPSSPPYLPDQGQSYSTHAVTLTTRGNYVFNDAFMTSLSGTINVQ